MKKVFFILATAIFTMSLNVLANDLEITKNVGTDINLDNNVTTGDSTAVIGFNRFTNTISVGFGRASNNVNVQIYRNGSLVMDDVDMVEQGTTLSYTINDTEGGDYDINVLTDGKLRLVESVEVR